VELWPEESVSVGSESVCESPVMVFPIKKRIHTELFIDRTAALYVGKTCWRLLVGGKSTPCVETLSWSKKMWE